jgi:hypothetical protein
VAKIESDNFKTFNLKICNSKKVFDNIIV